MNVAVCPAMIFALIGCDVIAGAMAALGFMVNVTGIENGEFDTPEAAKITCPV